MAAITTSNGTTLTHNISPPGKHILLTHKRRKFEDQRSEALFRVLEYNWIICPIGLTICFFRKLESP